MRIIAPRLQALVVMTWTPLLADVLDVLRVGDLRYSWQYAWTFETREKTALHRHRVFDGWKPILVFHRGEPDPLRPYIYDVIRCVAADKRFHAWGQSVDGFRRLVRFHALPSQLVCDPFLGAGTTGVAALLEGRRFVGCDVDAEAVEVARGRLQSDTLTGTECPGDAETSRGVATELEVPVQSKPTLRARLRASSLDVEEADDARWRISDSV